MAIRALSGYEASAMERRAWDARLEPTGGSGLGSRASGYAAVAVAGVAGLIDEVVWARALGFRLGTATFASSLVVGLLVLGWGCGAWFAGRSRALGLRLAALGQAVAAIAALLLPELALASSGWPTIARDIALLALVVLGAAAMGVTLPAWIGVVEGASERRAVLGAWNGWSSAGSTLGALLAGFALLPLGGIHLAAGVSALLHGAASIAAWTCARSASSGRPASLEPELAAPLAAVASLGPGFAAWLAFASGFVTVAAQGLALRWTLLCFLGFAHVFAAIGAVGLLAYASGSFAGGLRLRDARASARRIASALLLAAVGFGVAPFVLERLPGTSGSSWFAASAPAWRQIAGVLLHAAAFAALPIACAAAWLPLASTALGGSPAARAGRALFWSGAGAASAPLLTHLVLVPALGSLRAAIWIGALLALTAAWLATAHAGGHARRGIGVALGIALVVLGCFDSVASPQALYERSPLLRAHPEFSLRTAHEDAVFAVAVVDDARQAERTLLTDNFRAAGTGDDYAYMAHLGSLPLQLAPVPERVLVIAFGTGTTAGAVAAHPAVRELDIVEIAPTVLRERRAFRAVNEAVDAPPSGAAVRFHLADGRRFLESSPATWDAITLEPLLPYAPGAVHFYTREFHELARSHLRPGGTLTHWIPATSVPPREVRALLRTFANGFPHAGLWLFGPSLVVVGSDRPLRFAPRTELDAAGWEEALCAVCDRAGLLALEAEPEISDAHPWIEFLGVRSSLERLAWYRENLAMLVPHFDAAFGDALVADWRGAPELERLWPVRRAAQGELFAYVLEEERVRWDRIAASRGAAIALPSEHTEEERLARWEELDRRAQSAPTTRSELERRLGDYYLRACAERLQRAGGAAASFHEARALLREAQGLAERLQRLRPHRFEPWLYGGAAQLLASADPTLTAEAARRNEAVAALALRHAAVLHPAVFEDVEARSYLDPLLEAWLPGGRRAVAAHLDAARALGERLAARELPDDLATICAWIGNGSDLGESYFRAFRAVQLERALWSRRFAAAAPSDATRAAFGVLARWLPRARRADMP